VGGRAEPRRAVAAAMGVEGKPAADGRYCVWHRTSIKMKAEGGAGGQEQIVNRQVVWKKPVNIRISAGGKNGMVKQRQQSRVKELMSRQ